MLDISLDSVGAISVLKLRGIMEMPDVSILSAYCAIGRSILVVDLLETKKLLPEGHKILLDAAGRVKPDGGRIIVVATPEQPCGDDFSLSDDFVVYGARDQAIFSAEALHRERFASTINTDKQSARIGSFGRILGDKRKIPVSALAPIDARKAELLQELKVLEERRDQAVEQDRIAADRLADLQAAAATVEAVATVEVEEMKAELEKLIAKREEFRNDFENHQLRLQEERHAALEVGRVEEAAIRVEIAYLEGMRANLEADIDKAKKSLVLSAGRELAQMKNTPVVVKGKTLQFRPRSMKTVFAKRIFSKSFLAAMIAVGLSLLIAPFFLAFLAVSDLSKSSEAIAVVQENTAPQNSGLAVPPPVAPIKKILTLRILNGTGKNGLAAGVEAVLPRDEFKILETKNADRFGYVKTLIRATKDDAERVRSAMNLGVIEVTPPSGSDVVVILGADARNVFTARPKNFPRRPKAVEAGNAATAPEIPASSETPPTL